MRARLNLEALSEYFEIVLVVIRDGTQADEKIPDDLVGRCSSCYVLNMPTANRGNSKSNLAILLDCLNPQAQLLREYPEYIAVQIFDDLNLCNPPDLIHCYRLGLSNIARRLASLYQLSPDRIGIDLDDFESMAAKRAASRYRRQRGLVCHIHDLYEAKRIAVAEREIAQNCGQLFLCSQGDAERFRKQFPRATVSVVPNGYRIGDMLPLARKANNKAMAFVGTLSYGPNTDALEYLFEAIWPKLQQLSNNSVELIVAGRSPPPKVIELCRRPCVRLLADPNDIREAYLPAQVLIVPLRIGGGTRIKILEALSLGRPVVSTTIGAEGLDLIDGEHLLIADQADDFANACRRLIENPDLCKCIVNAGRSRVEALYGPHAIGSSLIKAYEKRVLKDD